MEYLGWLKEEDTLYTADGKEIKVFRFESEENERILNDWARHFRDNYRTLQEVDEELEGTGKTRAQYYIEDIFPDAHQTPGPSTRVGDFCELLLADYVEFVRDYYVPRTRYCRKINRNMSPNGSDVIGFKQLSKATSDKDEVFVVEVKGGSDPKGAYKGSARLQDAIQGSRKDITRYAESLNAIKRKLLDNGDKEHASVVARFQNKTDRPYLVHFGAAAVLTNAKYNTEEYLDITTSENAGYNIEMLVIHNRDLQSLVAELYRRAANAD